MKIIQCTNKNEWNDYFLKQNQAEFLQSWQWGEFQEKTGKVVLRLQVIEDNRVIGQVQGFEQRIVPGVKFIYLPKMGNYPEVFDFLSRLGYFFARIEPNDILNIPDKYTKTEVNNRQPKDTIVLDIVPSSEDLLERMHGKTRYNIKLAEKKGVTVKEEKSVDVFWKLNQETFSRDKFKSHDREYYTKMLEMENCHQLTAYVGSAPIASNILIHFGDVVTYLHGASSNAERNLMAPYLLQWQGILLAKKLGAKKYDFGGVSPEKKNGQSKTITSYHNYSWDATHRWTGITRFKAGFGGVAKSYPPAVEVIFKKFLYKIFQRIKSIV